MDLKAKAKNMTWMKNTKKHQFTIIKHSFTRGYILVETLQKNGCLSLGLQPYFYKFAHLLKTKYNEDISSN